MSNQRWLRVIPIATVMFIIAFIDRTNISLALPAISRDLHINSTQAGNIAGIFFWGYIILQIPAGHLAERWSAKWYVTILLVAWGTFGVACGLAQTWRELWVTRFFLGVSQSGMFPATIILLSHWFPRRERARANALFSLALPLALITSSPLSGWILDRWNWRVMLVVEGALPFLWLLPWILCIKDYPRQAGWISTEDRKYLEEVWEREKAEAEPATPQTYLRALLNPQVLALCCIQFCVLTGQLGYLFWLPSAIGKAKHLSNLSIGMLLIIPYVIGGISMVVNSWHSDKCQERRGHVTMPLALGGMFLLTGVLLSSHSPNVAFVFISLAAMAAFATSGPFWALNTELFSKRIAGSVVGLVNGMGHLGGYFGPLMVGYLYRRTGNFLYGFGMLSVVMMVGSTWPFLLLRRPAGPRSPTQEHTPYAAEPERVK